MKIYHILFIIFISIKVNLSLDNCQTTFDSDSQFCTNCNTGYELKVDGTCSKCASDATKVNEHCFTIKNCQQYYLYAEGEKCLTCNSNYELNEDSTQCTQCKEGEISEGKKCHAKIDNCETHYSYQDDDDDEEFGFYCDTCKTGYHLVQDYTKCSKDCENTSQIRPFSTCVNPIENCLIYNSENKCEECDERYQLKDNKCVPCPDYYKSNGKTCFLRHFKCEEYDKSGNCIACGKGYKLSSGSCSKNGSGMNIYNSFSFKMNIIALLLIILF